MSTPHAPTHHTSHAASNIAAAWQTAIAPLQAGEAVPPRDHRTGSALLVILAGLPAATSRSVLDALPQAGWDIGLWGQRRHDLRKSGRQMPESSYGRSAARFASLSAFVGDGITTGGKSVIDCQQVLTLLAQAAKKDPAASVPDLAKRVLSVALAARGTKASVRLASHAIPAEPKPAKAPKAAKPAKKSASKKPAKKTTKK